MAGNQQLEYHGQEEDNEETGIIHSTSFPRGKNGVNFTVSSEINKTLLKKETWIIKKDTGIKPKMQLASAHVSAGNIIGMINTFDRPGEAIAEGPYAQSGTYGDCPENKPGKRLPKIGAYAEAGVGLVRAEFSVFDAEAKGPNASAGAEASETGVGAMARAEVGSVSANAGPLRVKAGLGFDTGAYVGVDRLEVKVLGTGISIGTKTSISVLGSEASCSVM